MDNAAALSRPISIKGGKIILCFSVLICSACASGVSNTLKEASKVSNGWAAKPGGFFLRGLGSIRMTVLEAPYRHLFSHPEPSAIKTVRYR